MIKFYYNPLSPLARRVWITLLEKRILFEPILMHLNGDQFNTEFLSINPFHHVPVIVDDELTLIESLAIMDYLEAKYPETALLPANPIKLAKVRMIQMVTINELSSKILPLITEAENSPQHLNAQQEIIKVLQFFSVTLNDKLYFGDDQFTLGDIVAGNAVILVMNLGIEIHLFPNLQDWCERLMSRDVWQQVKLKPEEYKIFKRKAKAVFKHRQQQLSVINP
jgi:glutathione S-transferase